MDDNTDSDESQWIFHPEQHHRVIIHIDIDCFYAQVEMVRNPELKNKPVGVKQKYLMVTSNYIARSLGVKKQMYVKEALKVLPELILIDGSDLTPYRKFSLEISSIANTFTPHVERMGLDENFLDVTEKLDDYLEMDVNDVKGHSYGDKELEAVLLSDPCGCGCYKRLIIGSYIASELRKKIFEMTGITCCAGIAHNKVIAKMVSGYHKPNQQTVIFPWQVRELLRSVEHIKSIPGIGSATCKTLSELRISSVQDLQTVDKKVLKTKFDEETCQKLKNFSYGIDDSPVHGSILPQSIGIEDAFTVNKVTSFDIIKSKYEVLVERLLKLLADDGRVPGTLRIVVRRSDGVVKFGPRESKQVPLSFSLFSKGVEHNSDVCKSSIFKLVMNAFHKMVDVSKPFCLTLIGLGLTKFVERQPDSKSIKQYFKKRTGEQSDQGDKVKKPRSDADKCNSKDSIFQHKQVDISEKYDESIQVNRKRTNNNIVIEEKSTDSDNHSETELLTESFSKEKPKNHVSENDLESNIVEQEGSRSVKTSNCLSNFSGDHVNHVPTIPCGIDIEVFHSLPEEIQKEILSYKSTEMKMENKLSPKSETQNKKQNGSPKCSVKNYFSVDDKRSAAENKKCNNESSCNKDEESISKPSCSYNPKVSGGKLHVKELFSNSSINKDDKNDDKLPIRSLPPDIDPDVFSALPEEMQKEILRDRSVKPTGRSASNVHIGKKEEKSGSPSILKYFKKV